LTDKEKKARELRKKKSKREDPQAARKRKMAFRKNRSKIAAGRKRFMKSAAGKKLAKARGLAKRRGIIAWIDQHHPGLVRLPESKLDLAPFEELRIIATETITAPSLKDAVVKYLGELKGYADEFVGEIFETSGAQKELDEILDDVHDFILARPSLETIAA
jgi:hypothetical protein